MDFASIYGQFFLSQGRVDFLFMSRFAQYSLHPRQPGKQTKKLTNWKAKWQMKPPMNMNCTLFQICSGQYCLPTCKLVHIMPNRRAIAMAMLTGPFFSYRFFSMAISLCNFYNIIMIIHHCIIVQNRQIYHTSNKKKMSIQFITNMSYYFIFVGINIMKSIISSYKCIAKSSILADPIQSNSQKENYFRFTQKR